MHDIGCPSKAKEHSDAAKRISDTYNLHRVAKGHDAIGYWFACALQDGTSDNVLYDSKPDAISHQHNRENYYTFIQIVPTGMSICDAAIMLDVARRIYDKGGRMSDGYSRHELIRRLSREDQFAQIRRLN